jgi:hypothetical protein
MFPSSLFSLSKNQETPAKLPASFPENIYFIIAEGYGAVKRFPHFQHFSRKKSVPRQIATPIRDIIFSFSPVLRQQ